MKHVTISLCVNDGRGLTTNRCSGLQVADFVEMRPDRSVYCRFFDGVFQMHRRQTRFVGRTTCPASWFWDDITVSAENAAALIAFLSAMKPLWLVDFACGDAAIALFDRETIGTEDVLEAMKKEGIV